MTSLGQDIAERVRRVLPASGAPYSLHEPNLGEAEWAQVKQCMETGWVSSAGGAVESLETALEDFTGASHAVATVNGTAALHTCLMLAGVKPGDEVLLPTLTFVATANVVSYCGAIPHFVDSEPNSFGVDAAKLADYLKDIADVDAEGCCRNRQTGRPLAALIVVHCMGHPADLDALSALCEDHGIILIEDAAAALGSYYRGQHVGRHGLLSALSFNGNKIVTTGGGGAVLVNDGELAQRAKSLTTTARRGGEWEHVHDAVGYNYRLPALNAALGCAQMERLDGFLSSKRKLAERYEDAFRDLNAVTAVTEPDYGRSNFWMNTILLDGEYAAERDQILQAAIDAGFVCGPAWRPMHRLAMYADCPRMALNCAEDLQKRVINLPSSAGLVDA